MDQGRWRWVAIAAAVVYLGLALHAAKIETPTVDEFGHLPAGTAYLRHGSFDLFSKNPPLMKMVMAAPLVVRSDIVVPEPGRRDFAPGWGPWEYGDRFMRENAEEYFDLFFAGRVVVVLAGLACAWLLYIWSLSVFDRRAAAITTTTFLLTPLVIAHTHLATVDAGSMLTIFIAAFALRGAYLRPSHLRFVAAGGAWGLALLVKYTAILLAPALLIVIIARDRHRPALCFARLSIVAATALLTLNLGMGFEGSFRPLSDYRVVSSFGTSVQEVLPGWLPVPLPEAYVKGFDSVKRDTEHGEFGSYLLGEWSMQGWWYYDLFAMAVKNPVPFSLMILACPLFLIRGRHEKEELLFILAPIFVLALVMAGFNRIQIGARYLLPLMPFLFLCFAGIWQGLKGRTGRIARLLVPAWFLFAALSNHPGHLSYFNLAVGGAKNGPQLLIDSNLDWGQDLYRLRPALRELGFEDRIELLYFGHVDPALYGIDFQLLPPGPVESVFAVSVNYLKGYPYPATRPGGGLVPIGSGHVSWLAGVEPVARLGSIWLFDTRR